MKSAWKYGTALIAFLLSAQPARPATPYLHKFQIWGAQNTQEKLGMLLGFTNGFFYARQEFAEVSTCLSAKMSYEQATAMVDKFYNANPEKWNLSLARGILLALTVKDGPCPETLTPADM